MFTEGQTLEDRGNPTRTLLTWLSGAGMGISLAKTWDLWMTPDMFALWFVPVIGAWILALVFIAPSTTPFGRGGQAERRWGFTNLVIGYATVLILVTFWMLGSGTNEDHDLRFSVLVQVVMTGGSTFLLYQARAAPPGATAEFGL